MQIAKTLCTAFVAVSTMMLPIVTFGQAYGTVNVETLNMRKDPSTEAMNMGQLDKGDEIEILDRASEEWLRVRTDNGNTAFVFSPYVDVREAEGEITGQGVRLRTYPDVDDSEIIKSMNSGDTAVIEYTVGDWCKVIQGGKEGFVSKQYIDSKFLDEVPTEELKDVERVEKSQVVETVTHTKPTQSSKPSTPEPTKTSTTQAPPQAAPAVTNSNSGVGQNIAQDAKQFVGGPYVYGGNSLTNGVDCSGFTQQIMKRHGISISRTSRSQYANDGYKVSKDQLQAGDLLFYGYNGVVSHVAIYTGNGQIVHANTSSTGILSSGMYETGKPYIGAKRVH